MSPEEYERMAVAVVHPDIAQDMPLIMPAIVAEEFLRHLVDAVEGRKVFNRETLQWEYLDDDVHPMGVDDE